MAHDVFISHSSRDKPFADAICATLEARKVRCWIAPRDIRPGMTWSGAIAEAIAQSRVMVLVFSAHANDSTEVPRELSLAAKNGVAILTFRLEQVSPKPQIEYYTNELHWLDAVTRPLEQHFDYLAETVAFLLSRTEMGKTVPPGTSTVGVDQAGVRQDGGRVQSRSSPFRGRPPRSRRTLGLIASITAIIIASIAVYFRNSLSGRNSDPVPSKLTTKPITPEDIQDPFGVERKAVEAPSLREVDEVRPATPAQNISAFEGLTGARSEARRWNPAASLRVIISNKWAYYGRAGQIPQATMVRVPEWRYTFYADHECIDIIVGKDGTRIGEATKWRWVEELAPLEEWTLDAQGALGIALNSGAGVTEQGPPFRLQMFKVLDRAVPLWVVPCRTQASGTSLLVNARSGLIVDARDVHRDAADR